MGKLINEIYDNFGTIHTEFQQVDNILSKRASDMAFLNGLISDEESSPTSIDPSPRAMIPRSGLNCVGFICDIPEHGEFKFIEDSSVATCTCGRALRKKYERVEVVDLRNANSEYFQVPHFWSNEKHAVSTFRKPRPMLVSGNELKIDVTQYE